MGQPMASSSRPALHRPRSGQTNQPVARLVVEVEFNNAGARDMQIIIATLAHPARVQPFVVKPTTVSNSAACMMG